MFVNKSSVGLHKKGGFVVSTKTIQTEIERRNVLRLSNEESNKLTRECIEAALVLLMNDRSFSEISITEIIQRAGVSRSAYYRNYSSKEDILENIFCRAAETIVGALSESLTKKNMLSSYQVLFEKVLEDKVLFEIIEKAGMVYTFQSTINEKYLSFVSGMPIEEYYRVLYWIGSVINVIFGWINRKYKETPEEMARICCMMVSEEEWHIGAGIKWEHT